MPDLTERIRKMHSRDIAVAWAFVVGLWLAIIFVALATWNLAPSSTARLVLLIGGHYREDRDFMYGLDIKFLDLARAQKKR